MQDEVQLETTKCVHAFPPAHMCKVPLCWSAVLPSLYLVSLLFGLGSCLVKPQGGLGGAWKTCTPSTAPLLRRC